MTHINLYWAVWTLAVIVIPILWIMSLRLQARMFKNLYRTIDQMNAQLALISGMLGIKDITPRFTLPSTCFSCGVTLMGGATQHKPNCEVRKLIDQHFPPVH